MQYTQGTYSTVQCSAVPTAALPRTTSYSKSHPQPTNNHEERENKCSDRFLILILPHPPSFPPFLSHAPLGEGSIQVNAGNRGASVRYFAADDGHSRSLSHSRRMIRISRCSRPVSACILSLSRQATALMGTVLQCTYTYIRNTVPRCCVVCSNLTPLRGHQAERPWLGWCSI